MQHEIKAKSLTGFFVAFTIVFLWIGSLVFFLYVDIKQSIAILIFLAILGRTFIQTGLFIVAHDAIHGSVIPSNLRSNNLVGRLAVTLYAFLSYQRLAVNHRQHHRYPGRAGDPDFHDGIHHDIFSWYLKFMTGYLDLRQTVVQFFGFGIIFLALHFWLHIYVANLLLFWLLPLLLSTIQLFLFGTYLPHRVATGETDNSKNYHYARSSNYPIVWSFLTCYHFGYHWEHHEYPFLPWYKLPSSRFFDTKNTLVSHQFERCEYLNETVIVVIDTK